MLSVTVTAVNIRKFKVRDVVETLPSHRRFGMTVYEECTI